MSPQAYFTPELFTFLTNLAAHNSREWFTANKARYEQVVRQPALRLISDLAQPLQTLSPQLIANPKTVGGSLFRIHRDTRFSADKTPYKTHVGISFYHAAIQAVARGDGGNAAMGRLDAPVLYLHIEPGKCFLGGGIWHPMPETTRRVRNYMLNNPASWKQATRSPAFTAMFELSGETLTRPPKGYDPSHELIQDLKRKDIVASAPIKDGQLLNSALPTELVMGYERIIPMIDWLCGALDLNF